MNVSADYASPAAIRPMLYGRSPRRSFIYSSADPQLRICRCPGACSTYIRVRIRGIRLFILRPMLCSHPTILIRASAAAIFCQPMFSASAFARRSVPDGRCPKLGHAPRASTFSKQSRHFPKLSFPEAVIFRSRHFPKPSFPGAVISRSRQSSSEKILSMISPIANSLCPSDVSAACSEPALSDAETPASLRGSPLSACVPALPVCIGLFTSAVPPEALPALRNTFG